MPRRKLKVFQAQFGFYESVVAAPSQAAALRAWGTKQNLFALGEAKLVTDGATVAAAMAHPEKPLLRAVGSSDAFALRPTSLPKVPDAPRRTTAKSFRAPKAVEPKIKPPADRSKLDVAEKALRRLDERRKKEEADLRYEEEALETRKAEAQSRYVESRKAATAALVEARTAYRAAGGKD